MESFIDSQIDKLDIEKAKKIYERCMEGELAFFAPQKDTRVRDYLLEGDFLLPGDKLFSCSKTCYLIYQEDGNLVVYKNLNATSWVKAIWATDTKDTHAWRTYMQDDGNFVVYTDQFNSVWSSDVYSPKYQGSQLVLEDDGRLVIYDSDKKVIWTSTGVKNEEQ